MIQGQGIHTFHKNEDLTNQPSAPWIILSNANMESLDFLNFNLGFHVIRDPRDVIVSSYFSHLYSHKTDQWSELSDHRKHLQSLTFNEGLIYEIEECRKIQFKEMQEWNYNNSKILELKFESLTQNPREQWFRILNHLKIDLSATTLQSKGLTLYNKGINFLSKKTGISFIKKFCIDNQISKLDFEMLLRSHQFETIARKKKGEENVNNHYRKGISGDWKNYFSEDHKVIFKENWGELLLYLGYESNNDW